VIAAVLVVLALATAAFVLAPLARLETGPVWEIEGDQLVHARETAYRALRDLEMDRATGKVDEADYAALRARFEADAVAVLHRLDARAAAAPKRAREEARLDAGGST